MAEETYPINLWINEERLEKLQAAGLASMTKEVLAGLKVIAVPTTAAQRDKILKLFTMAKYDAATTRSIENLPRKTKDQIFDLVVKNKSLNVMDEFIKVAEK
jgi:deoxyhypusine synthase